MYIIWKKKQWKKKKTNYTFFCENIWKPLNQNQLIFRILRFSRKINSKTLSEIRKFAYFNKLLIKKLKYFLHLCWIKVFVIEWFEKVTELFIKINKKFKHFLDNCVHQTFRKPFDLSKKCLFQTSYFNYIFKSYSVLKSQFCDFMIHFLHKNEFFRKMFLNKPNFFL